VNRAKELAVLRQKYAAVADPRARAAIAEYADDVYGRDWRVPAEDRRAEQPPPGRRPEHARLLRHIDQLNPTLRRIA
jgi:hypothetical protein